MNSILCSFLNCNLLFSIEIISDGIYLSLLVLLISADFVHWSLSILEYGNCQTCHIDECWHESISSRWIHWLLNNKRTCCHKSVWKIDESMVIIDSRMWQQLPDLLHECWSHNNHVQNVLQLPRRGQTGILHQEFGPVSSNYTVTLYDWISNHSIFIDLNTKKYWNRYWKSIGKRHGCVKSVKLYWPLELFHPLLLLVHILNYHYTAVTAPAKSP